MKLLRWGRSAYETDADLARECSDANALGLEWTSCADRDPPPLSQVDVLVTTSKVMVNGDIASQMARKLVVTTTSGVDHIDLASCRAHDVTVARCPLARRDPVLEHALTGMISLMRRVPDQLAEAVAGTWARGRLPEWAARGISGSRIVVVGHHGVIGSRMSEVLTAMGAQVVGVELGDDVAAALPNADAVTLHCSLTPTSVGLMSASMLDLLPNHAVVVNTARGGSLDVEAAVARVAEGRLRGVCVDVFPEEPYSRLAEGAAVPGVWFTPHSSGYTAGLGERVAAGVRSTLEAWLGDLPLPHRVL